MKKNSRADTGNRTASRRLSEQFIRGLCSVPPKLSLRQLEQLTGIPYNTICDWRGGKHHDVLRLVLLKLALAAERDRALLLSSFTPQCPTPGHSFFGTDPGVREKLTRLSQKPNGTTLIIGESEYCRSFVAMALTDPLLGKGGVTFGIDAAAVTNLPPADASQPCACLAPTRGVIYLSEQKGLDPHAAWCLIRNSTPGSGILCAGYFNGVWTSLGRHQREITALSKRAHLIIADRPHLISEFHSSRPDADVIRIVSPQRDSLANKQLVLDIQTR